ncbi:MAG: carbohydrate ABC transporter permease [Clostridia bacterium]|nr:carbohydrate ABC transporter permease [Clostridia bacterium]
MAEQRRGKLIAFLFLIILGVCWFEPIAWLVANSFRMEREFKIAYSGVTGPLDYLSRLIPKAWTLTNYTELFDVGGTLNTDANIGMMFQNSAIVSVVVTLGVVLITSLAAYAYERMNFKGGNKIFWALLYASMFPNIVSILPQFRIANALGWVNNLNALIWPLMSGVFNVFLIRNFMKGIPRELDEAAVIDGASSFQVYTQVILPSIKPVLMVVALFAFNGAWNDFLWPRIVMTDVNNQTLTAGLRLLMGQYDGHQAHLIASCFISMLPPFALYLCAQKYFLRGISVQASVKG